MIALSGPVIRLDDLCLVYWEGKFVSQYEQPFHWSVWDRL